MTPRKTILRELDRIHRDRGEGHFTRPNTIAGYEQRAAKYQTAVNDLLKDRLIDGQKDDDGKMSIAINPHRKADVRKELRPMLARPTVWVAFLVVAAAVATPFLI